jgi:hypothetical protein
MLMRVRWVSDRTRQLSKRGNPYLLKIAGTRLGMLYFNLSALDHVGRRSGRPYVTPLSAYPLGDGFVLAVAYPYVDWCEMCWPPGNALWVESLSAKGLAFFVIHTVFGHAARSYGSRLAH